MTAVASHKKGRVVARLGRGDRSPLGMWFWEIDRVLLLLVTILLSIGLIAVAAGSPAAAARYSGGNLTISPLAYFWKQLIWVALGLPIMIGFSMLPQNVARRIALAGAAFFSVILAFVPVIGNEVNGSVRWIGFGFAQFQPSEFLKPLFIVAMAWILSLKVHDRSLPVVPITGLLTLIVAGLLMMQPDFGQAIVFCSVWMALMLVSGMPMRMMGAMGGLGSVGIVAAYFLYPVAKTRINNFLFADGDTYQVDQAHATLTAGGFAMRRRAESHSSGNGPENRSDFRARVVRASRSKINRTARNSITLPG